MAALMARPYYLWPEEGGVATDAAIYQAWHDIRRNGSVTRRSEKYRVQELRT